MKKLKLIFIVLIIFSFNNLMADNNENLKSKITKNLRCLICQGQSVYDSDSEFADSIRIFVEKKIREGESEKQIYGYLKDKYGEWILYEPQFSKKTYFLWLLPILMFVLGGAIILKIFYLKKN